LARRRRSGIKEWYGTEVNALVRDHVGRGTRKAVQLIVTEVKKKINRGQKTRTAKSGRKYGLDPSKPGEPPKVVTSALKQSIKGKVKKEKNIIRGAVGSNLVYARALELGSPKTGLKKRPYLRSTVLENKQLIRTTIANG
jgi:hypothetical protein